MAYNDSEHEFEQLVNFVYIAETTIILMQLPQMGSAISFALLLTILKINGKRC